MTSAQASDDVGSTIEPTSSMPIFKRLYLVIYKTLALTFLYCWKNVKNYYYAKFQDDPGMFSYQNRRGLNQPILHPLWLMTSAEADVISVPSEKKAVSLKSTPLQIGLDIDLVIPTSSFFTNIMKGSSWMGTIWRPCSTRRGGAKQLFARLYACRLFWHPAFTEIHR